MIFQKFQHFHFLVRNKSEISVHLQIPALRDLNNDVLPNFKSEIDISLNRSNPVVSAFLVTIGTVAVLGFIVALVLR